MNSKKFLAAFLAVPVLWLICTVNATALRGVPAGLDQTKPAAAAPEAIRLPTGWQLTRMPRGAFRTEMALSPDGSLLVFSATPDGTMDKAMLYRRSLDRAESTVIPGTEGPCMPFFSPDGQWIGFWAKEKLNKVAVKGGLPSPICDLGTDTVGICWGSDGRIIFGRLGLGLGYVSAAGGTPGTLTTLDAGKEATHRRTPFRVGKPYCLPRCPLGLAWRRASSYYRSKQANERS
jgi:hypothetical protein